MSKVYFVTGASRGLGYEFVLQLLKVSTNHVIAAVRNKETSVELQKLAALHPGRVDLITMDVASTESVEKGTVETEALAAAKGGVDCVICNAGVLYGGWGTASEGSIADIEANMQINLYGVVRVSQSMLPLLRKGAGKQLVVLSSILGSIGGKTSETPVAATYSISKAAVNMYCMKLARELNPEGFTVIPIHPGYVSTDMNGGRAKAEGDIYQEESIEGMLKVITKATQAENGTFYNYAGENLPW